MPALNALAASGRAVPGLVAPLGGRLPIHDDALQAVASEPVKPMLDTVLLYLGTGTCVSGSDKGDRIFGGGVPAHGQRGNLPMQETIVSGLLETVPAFGQLKPLRQWAGVVDLVPDSSPILGPAGPEGLFLNCGRGTRATGGRMGISAVARCSRPRPRTWTSASVSVCKVTVIRCRPARIWCYRKRGALYVWVPAPEAAALWLRLSRLAVALDRPGCAIRRPPRAKVTLDCNLPLCAGVTCYRVEEWGNV